MGNKLSTKQESSPSMTEWYQSDVLQPEEQKTGQDVSTNDSLEKKSNLDKGSAYEECYEKYRLAIEEKRYAAAESHLANALREVFTENDQTRCIQCLVDLGNLYVIYGSMSNDGEDFTKAVALYNAALRRCEINHSAEEREDDIWQCIKRAESKFREVVLYEKAESLVSSKETDLNHRTVLNDSRNEVKVELLKLDEANDDGNASSEQLRIAAESKRIDRVYALSKHISTKLQYFIKKLLLESIEIVGTPPCKHAFLALGSMAREEITPYSDLEFAILIEEEKDNDATRQYFRNLTDTLHIKVLNLGETILPSMYIKCLNNYESKSSDENWFYDHITPRGLSFDGSMPWACKTPKGRKSTDSKPWISELIQTPSKMAAFQENDSKLKKGYKLAEVLSSVCLIDGDHGLLRDYLKHIDQILEKDVSSAVNGDKLTVAQERALKSLNDDYRKYNVSPDIQSAETGGKLHNVKQALYRFPSTIINSLGLYFNFMSARSYDILCRIRNDGYISQECMHNLMVLSTTAIEIRIRTYIERRGQRENASVIPALHLEAGTRDDVFHAENNEMMVRFYQTAIPLGEMLGTVFSGKTDLAKALSTSALYDSSWHTQGLIYHRLLSYQQAQECFEKAILESPDAIELHIWLARVLNCQKKTTEALSCMEKSFSIYESNKKMSNKELCTLHHTLGYTLAFMPSHKHDEALIHLIKAIEMTDTVQFKGDYIHIPTLITIGYVLSQKGDFTLANTYYDRALTALEQVEGKDAVSVYASIIYNNKGTNMLRLGKYEQAAVYHEKSLAVRKRIFGNVCHPLIAVNINALGAIYAYLGKHQKSNDHFREFKRMESFVSRVEPSAFSYHRMTNKGLILMKQDFDNHGALKCFHKALDMYEEVNEENNVKAVIHNNIGYALKNLGLFDKAGENYDLALEEIEKYCEITINQENLSLKARFSHNYGVLCLAQRTLRNALHYLDQALRIRREINETDNTLLTESYLGIVEFLIGEKALTDSVKAAEITIATHTQADKEPHWDHILTLNNLGQLYLCAGEYQKAIECHTRSVDICRKCYKTELHGDISDSLFLLGCAWQHFGDTGKAKEKLTESMSLMRRIYGETSRNVKIQATVKQLSMLDSPSRLDISKNIKTLFF